MDYYKDINQISRPLINSFEAIAFGKLPISGRNAGGDDDIDFWTFLTIQLPF